MKLEEKLFLKTLISFIELGEGMGLELDEIRNKVCLEIDKIKKKRIPKKRTKKNTRVKAIRVPLWISDSSDGENVK